MRRAVLLMFLLTAGSLAGCAGAPRVDGGVSDAVDARVDEVSLLHPATLAAVGGEWSACWRVEGEGEATTALHVQGHEWWDGEQVRPGNLTTAFPDNASDATRITLPATVCASLPVDERGFRPHWASAQAGDGAVVESAPYIVYSSEHGRIYATEWNQTRLLDWLQKVAFGGDAAALAEAVADMRAQGRDGVWALIELLIEHEMEAQGLTDDRANRTRAVLLGNLFMDANAGPDRDDYDRVSQGLWSILEDRADATGERPAVLTWWDYGVSAHAFTGHPPVADAPSSDYTLAASVFLAQSEAEVITRLAGALLPLIAEDERGSTVAAALPARSEADVDAIVDALVAGDAPDLTEDEALRLLGDLESATGRPVGYVAISFRMVSWDDPRSRFIDQTGIFWAYPFMLGRDAEDYTATMVDLAVSGRTYRASEWHEHAPDDAVAHEWLQFKTPYLRSFLVRAWFGEVDDEGRDTGRALMLAMGDRRAGEGLRHFSVVNDDEDWVLLALTPHEGPAANGASA